MQNLNTSPFAKHKIEKDHILTEQLLELTSYHRKHCTAYDRMLDALDFDEKKVEHYRDLPFLPVGLFKRMLLSSIDSDENEVDSDGTAIGNIKTVTSSGTSSDSVSKIILDGDTRTRQQQALAEIGAHFLGEERMPMLVIDCPATVKKKTCFSARTAGIQGFSIFGRRRVFALRDDMTVDEEAVTSFLEKYGDKPYLMFGFTYIIWKYIVLIQQKFDFSNGILIHGGGWKKLEQLAVSKAEFKTRLRRQLGLERIHDYYGMAEQTGSIFMECECGHLHASDYSGILFRRAEDFSICDIGERGIVQVLSTLPRSYPGHSLLTEDEGMLLGEDDCPCGRKGAYFQIFGRIKNARIRGCSDTYEG